MRSLAGMFLGELATEGATQLSALRRPALLVAQPKDYRL
jgi:hypothetical protein